MRGKRWALALGLALAMSAGAAVPAQPSVVKAQYRITKAGITIGNVEETFTREGERYRIVSETRTAGPLKVFLKDRLTVTSEGRVGAGGLMPQRYEFRRDRDAHKNVFADFDWAAGRIVSRHGDVTESFSLPVGTLDRVSAMYQFMFSAPSSETVVAWMSQGKKAEKYTYRKAGEPALTVAGRDYATVRYRRDAAAGESKAELWLAKDAYFLPVKMAFEDASGLALEQTLVSLSLQ